MYSEHRNGIDSGSQRSFAFRARAMLFDALLRLYYRRRLGPRCLGIGARFIESNGPPPRELTLSGALLILSLNA